MLERKYIVNLQDAKSQADNNVAFVKACSDLIGSIQHVTKTAFSTAKEEKVWEAEEYNEIISSLKGGSTPRSAKVDAEYLSRELLTKDQNIFMLDPKTVKASEKKQVELYT